ncbi:hypothetical protein IX51_07465 [uncultured archaeon]|nr:hypothetical protein IX51_07465 [uncultured archaeon]
METDQVLRDIVVQGTLLDYNTDVYASIMKKTKDSREFSDPFARLVASTFKLCEEGVIDPWNVDLRGFSKIFISIIDETFDRFGMAGYLIGQAWHILLEKTERSVMKRQQLEVPETYVEEGPDDGMESPVLEFEPRALELSEPVKHREKRQVMLVELLEAMRVAVRKERKRVHTTRQEKEEFDATAMEEIIFELHAEEPEKEIDNTYEKILSQFADQFYIEEIWGSSVEDRWGFFVYCLFLMREKRIILKQEGAFGKISIQRIARPDGQVINI